MRDARQWQIGRARGQIQANIWTTSGEKILEKSDLQTNWKQVIQTWNGEVLKLFINGQFMAEISALGQLASSDEPVRIGAGKDRYFFKGAVDEVRIYNRSLSDDEISALLNNDEIDALFDLNKVMKNINKIYKRLGLTI